MAELTDAEFGAQCEAATARGRDKLRAEPRAVSARYDRETGRVVVELANGCTHIFPTRLAQELAGAGDEVDGAGFNLHWPVLDVDLYVPALVAGMFDTRAWMAQDLAQMAGSTATPAKAAVARANGKGDGLADAARGRGLSIGANGQS